MEQTGLAFRPFLHPAILLPVAALLIGLSVAAYRRTTRPISARTRGILLALRLGAAIMLLLCLLRPSLETVRHDMARRPLVFLLDRSGSMTGITDTPTGVSRRAAVENLLQENAEELEDLRRRYDLMEIDFARGLLGPQEATDPLATRRSAYGLALRQALEQTAGGRADAVVLFGDGSHNYGPPQPMDVAAELNAQGVTLYAVGVGQDTATAGLRDVKMMEVTVPDSVFLFSSFPVRVRVTCRGCQGMELPIQVKFADQPIRRKEVHISHPEEVVPFEFDVVPEQKGEFKLTVTAGPLPDELLETNNSASTFVKVVSEGVSVGFFDVLRPESKFVTHSLIGTKNLQLRRLLVLRGQMLSEEKTDMQRYEVVVLGDLAPSSIRASRLQQLKERVQEEGKGLVVLAGEEAWAANGFQNTDLKELLPVEIPDSLRRVPRSTEMKVVPEHAAHPALTLKEQRADTLEEWSRLPRLGDVFVGAQPKRGAIVLAEDQEGNPLLVVHRSKAGRVAFLLTSTSFRWFFTEKDTQDLHRRFWRQLLLWASGWTERHETEVRLELSRHRLPVGEDVKMRLIATRAREGPIRDADVSLEVIAPDGARHQPSLTFSRAEEAYLAEYTPAAPGDYEVTARLEREGKEPVSDRNLFRASDDNPELEDPIANLKLLRRMAAATEKTGGDYYSYLRIGELFRKLKQQGEPLKLTTRRREDIWDGWPFFAAFAACMVSEWVLRKWKGLM